MPAVTPAGSPVPERVAVVGAGMVGLATTACSSRSVAVEVTVIDRDGVAAGASRATPAG